MASVAESVTVSVQFVAQCRNPVLNLASEQTHCELPVSLARYSLSELVNQLLQRETPVPFDFLIGGEYLRTSLHDYLVASNQSVENLLTIVYKEAFAPPERVRSQAQQDWVSALCGGKTFFVSGSYDGIVRFWNPTDMAPYCELSGHGAPIKSVAVAEGNETTRVASSSKDLTARVHDVDSQGSVLRTVVCVGHEDSVEGAALDSTGTWLVTASWDGSVRTWQLEEGALQRAAPVEEPATKKQRRDDHELLVEASTIMLGHTGGVCDAVFEPRPAARGVVSAGQDHSIRIWDLEAGVFTHTMNAECPAHSVSCALNGLVVSGHSDSCARLWDRRIGAKSVATFRKPHDGFVSCVTFATQTGESGTIFGSTCYDGHVRLWDIRSSVPLSTVGMHNGRALALAFLLRDEESDLLLASGGTDCQLNMYDSVS